jgi:predicted metal-dependent phosphoesterase TrpH
MWPVLGRLHHSMMDLSNFLARVTLSRIEFADRHKADGATITFHHVFDFTVTASMAMQLLGKEQRAN